MEASVALGPPRCYVRCIRESSNQDWARCADFRPMSRIPCGAIVSGQIPAEAQRDSGAFRAADARPRRVATSPIGPVEFTVCESVMGDERFRYFTCGWPGMPAVQEINADSRHLARGHRLPGGKTQLVVLTATETNQLIGWAGLQRRHLCELNDAGPCEPCLCPNRPPPPPPILESGLANPEVRLPLPFPRGVNIVAIATAYAFQGRRLDDGRRPGDVLIDGVLSYTPLIYGEQPYIWARVLKNNPKSLRLFKAHGFEHFPRPQLPEDICARPAGLPPL